MTASGLLFIAATIYDLKICAFYSRTGQLLWLFELPYAGAAAPATYLIDGKQFVVISTSNAKNPRAAGGLVCRICASVIRKPCRTIHRIEERSL